MNGLAEQLDNAERRRVELSSYREIDYHNNREIQTKQKVYNTDITTPLRLLQQTLINETIFKY